MRKILFPKLKSRYGFTLIELIVAIFIFSVMTVAIVSVFASSAGAYQKSRYIKIAKQNIEYAMSSLAKDMRMGTIEKVNNIHANGEMQKFLLVKRNRDAVRVCYMIDSLRLGRIEGIDESSAACPESGYMYIVDLTGKNMQFDSERSYFTSCPTNMDDGGRCGEAEDFRPDQNYKKRGWVLTRLKIIPDTGKEMEADTINVQTLLSSRDYGWEEVD